VWVEAAAQNRSLIGRDSERETITPIEFLAAAVARTGSPSRWASILQ
jgi:hypothetical protein